jgi:glucosamine--fructose-6-phosphate aminotransferase (isomerizing)
MDQTVWTMNKSLLNNDYLNDILHQPESLRDTIAGLESLHIDEIQPLIKCLSDNSLKNVVLTGMGSSYHALHPLHLTLIEHGIWNAMLETSELIHFAPKLLTPETLVVAVSQSGQSVEILQLLEMTNHKIPLLGVTNTAESPLAQKSDAVVMTYAGSEHSVSCKTYITSLAALLILGNLLTGQKTMSTLTALRSTADSMEKYLSHWEEYLESALQRMQGIHHLILTGRGASMAAASTGGLITKESAHFHAEGMSSAAFRHGPFEMVSSTMFVEVFAGIGPTQQLNANLVADIQKTGGLSELISRGENTELFCLPPVPDICLPLMEILPIQITSVALAILNNHIPGRFERGTKITVIE